MTKQVNYSLIVFFASVLSVGFLSCSSDNDEKEEPKKEKEAPVVNLPIGSDDVFANGMNFDSSASEKELVFTTNVTWAITVA